MKKVLLILLALILILGLTGCGLGEVRANKERIVDPEVSEADVSALVEDNSAFAFDLYQELKETESNLFYSPYSLSLALAMTYAGARGETERQMAEVLHFDVSQERLHPAFNSLDSELARRDDKREDFRLSIINALWGQKDYTFHDDFLVTLAENYGAGMRLVDYKKSPEDSRLTINDWVSRQTDGKITELIPPGQGIINDLTRLVLTNIIYFSAEWEHKFLEANYTKNRPFYLKDGSEITVPMMASRLLSLNYSEGDGYQAVELPYEGEELSMVVILPDTGRFNEFETTLDGALAKAIIDDLETARVQMRMPRFSFESGFLLKKALSDMGMPVAFIWPHADFSGMTDEDDLFIRDVVHQAWVSVDESGTEAAAASAIAAEAGLEEGIIEFTIDRPFIFLIRDIETGTILFVGRVLNPLES